MSKSAQFPLHMWLPDSLYAPTPVHALLHAGIINAGGFLLTRLAPLYDQARPRFIWFSRGHAHGLTRLVHDAGSERYQKNLGYSTIGQMGFMIMECGARRLRLGDFSSDRAWIVQGLDLLELRLCHSCCAQGAEISAKTLWSAESVRIFLLTWLTGFVTTLILPLVIVLAAHGIVNIPLRDSQGAVIFLFFGWATSSQAILTLYRLRAVASWKIAVSMLSAFFVVV